MRSKTKTMRLTRRIFTREFKLVALEGFRGKVGKLARTVKRRHQRGMRVVPVGVGKTGNRRRPHFRAKGSGSSDPDGVAPFERKARQQALEIGFWGCCYGASRISGSPQALRAGPPSTATSKNNAAES